MRQYKQKVITPNSYVATSLPISYFMCSAYLTPSCMIPSAWTNDTIAS